MNILDSSWIEQISCLTIQDQIKAFFFNVILIFNWLVTSEHVLLASLARATNRRLRDC